MSASKFAASTGLIVALAIAVGGCPASNDPLCAGDVCANTTNDGCFADPTIGACLNDSTALFVSVSGDDGAGDGTRAHPFRSIATALGKLALVKRRIYVCAGTYAEDVKLTVDHSNLAIFGGVDCAWHAAPGVKPVIGASANPFTITSTTSLTLVDLAITAEDATSGSSVALFAFGAQATLTSVVLAAGAGAQGVKGASAGVPLPRATGGSVPSATAGGPAPARNLCPGGVASGGGAGGAPAAIGGGGIPLVAGGGLAGQSSSCSGDGNGQNGATPPSPTLPPATQTLGILSASGWLPTDGAAGTDGKPGGGGGGGFGGTTSGGASGGDGGCGGLGGKGGGGGGASIALLSDSSMLTVVGSKLTSKNAGNGGQGGASQQGQGGGSGGTVTPPFDGCAGGAGATGAFGSSGRGGAGGVSLGVGYNGSMPLLDSATTTAVQTGQKGTGGLDSSLAMAINGVAAAMLELK